MPRPSVFACFLCPHTGEILLVRQQRGKWSLPGGRCSRGENPMTALRREVREETSYAISATAKPALAWQIRRRWRRRGRDAVVYLFRERPDAMTPLSEIEAVGWFALDSLPHAVTRTALAAIRECRQLPEILAAQVG